MLIHQPSLGSGLRAGIDNLSNVEVLAGRSVATVEQAEEAVDRVDEPAAFSYVLDAPRPAVAMWRPGARRWEWMLLPGEDPARMTDPATVRGLLAGWVDPETVRVERAAVFTFHARTASRWRRQRVLLAGDAAHSMPPFVGQGWAWAAATR
jgi:2-polyprenyl-6-methoxyphenol hydroxylase-like FAD-dependent oxidoreductase